MKTLIFLILISVTATATAADLTDVRIGNLMVSNHWLSDSDHTNEDHSASFYACYSDYCAGWFEHSYDDTAHLAFWDPVIYENSWAQLRLPVGAVSGYQGYSKDEDEVISPFLALTATLPIIETDHINASVRIWQIGNEVTAAGFELSFY